MAAPINHIKLVASLNTKAPNNPEMIKLEAVEMTVGTKVLVSFE